MKSTNYLYYITISLIPIGQVFRIFDIPLGNLIFTTGLLGVVVYFLAKLTKQIIKKHINKFNVLLEILIISISPIFFSKYLYHSFGDYIGLIVIPIFVIVALIYLIKHGKKDLKITLISIIYILLVIPLFDIQFNKNPRNYIPLAWYDRYNVKETRPILLPAKYKYPETKELSENAFEYKQSGDYSLAIILYRKAIEIEPKNKKLLFEISNCYANTNELELAIAYLDTAILIDSTYSIFYNNRGLLHYKLKESEKAILDYEKAIKLDSTQSLFYANLALVYNYQKKYDKACEYIKKAEKLGEDISKFKTLKRIKKRKCN